MMQEDIQKRKYKDGVIIKRLLKYGKPFIPKFILAGILTIFITIAQLLPPFLLGRVVTSLAMPEIPINTIMMILLIYLAVLVATAFLDYSSFMVLKRIGQSVVYNIRGEVFTHIEALSIEQINAHPVGRLVTRVTNDSQNLEQLFSDTVVNLIKYILTIIFIIAIMFSLNAKLSLFVLCVTPIILVLTYFFRKVSRKNYRATRSALSGVNAFLSENLSGMKLTQIFNQEDKKLEEFRKKNNEYRRRSLKEIVFFGLFRPSIYVMYVLTSAMVLYVGSHDVMASFGLVSDDELALLVGSLVSFYEYIGQLFNPIQNLADQFNFIQSAFASSERIFEILDTEIIIQNKEDAKDYGIFKGEIEFKNVWFAYEGENWILQDISFHVLPRQTVAFVGATGAGKTTILSLIVRNYEIQKGQILIDGIDIKDIDIDCLRKNVGQMLQDVFLFSGSIKSNITLRDDSIPIQEIEKACKYVNADTFIEKLPKKYDYIVTERGKNFSNGQRQLISFARTLVYKPNIMILDEATANIDTETEVLIQDSLEKMMSIGTMLIVAHRLSTIQHADNIIVIHKGKIVESGTHQELLHKRGLYYNLYELQYKDK